MTGIGERLQPGPGKGRWARAAAYIHGWETKPRVCCGVTISTCVTVGRAGHAPTNHQTANQGGPGDPVHNARVHGSRTRAREDPASGPQSLGSGDKHSLDISYIKGQPSSLMEGLAK